MTFFLTLCGLQGAEDILTPEGVMEVWLLEAHGVPKMDFFGSGQPYGKYVPACLPACPPACLLACLLACLPACLLACWLGHMPAHMLARMSVLTYPFSCALQQQHYYVLQHCLLLVHALYA